MRKQTTTNRRNFLKLSLLSAGGLGLAPAVHAAQSDATFPERKIIYRTLGRTGIKVPIVSIGKPPVDNPNLVKLALKLGYTHIDTAYRYNEGKNEEMLGKVLKDVPRKSFSIATKIYQPKDRETGKFTPEATEENFMEKLRVSLERLQMEYVDVLYLHAVSHREAVLHQPTINAMKKAKELGLARFTGISTHRNEPEMIQAAIDSNFYDVVLTTYNYRQSHAKEIEAAIEKASNAGLGVVAMKVMAGAFKDKEKTQPINYSAALKWVVQNENVHTAIIHCDTFAHVEENFKVAKNYRLRRRERKELENDDRTGGLFCPGCRQCVPQCRHNLPIPELMRAYMYAYGYRQLAEAQDLVLNSNLPENLCADCKDCTVTQCTQNFDIKQKINDIARIKTLPREMLV